MMKLDDHQNVLALLGFTPGAVALVYLLQPETKKRFGMERRSIPGHAAEERRFSPEPHTRRTAYDSPSLDLDEEERRRAAELAEIAPNWASWGVFGLFGLGWIGVGLLWNFRWLGVALAIAVMAAVTYGVVRLTLVWDPRLRAELDRQSRWLRGFAIVCALAMFIVAMLALVQMQVDFADSVFDASLPLPKDIFETPSKQHLKDTLRLSGVKDASDVKLLPAGGHAFGTTGPQYVWKGAFGTLFFYTVVWALFYTRRYRKTWKHSSKPSLNVTWSCLSTLLIVHVLHVVIAGYSTSGTDSRDFRYAATSAEMEAAVERWAAGKGYVDISHRAYGIYDEGGKGRKVGRLRFLHLSPSSWFDRYRASWRYIVLCPRPRLYLTLVAQDVPAEAYLRVNLPYHATDSAEPSWWRELVDDLDRSIRAAVDTSNGTSLSDRGFEPQLRFHQIAYFDPQRVGDGEDRRNSWV